MLRKLTRPDLRHGPSWCETFLSLFGHRQIYRHWNHQMQLLVHQTPSPGKSKSAEGVSKVTRQENTAFKNTSDSVFKTKTNRPYPLLGCKYGASSVSWIVWEVKRKGLPPFLLLLSNRWGLTFHHKRHKKYLLIKTSWTAVECIFIWR